MFEWVVQAIDGLFDTVEAIATFIKSVFDGIADLLNLIPKFLPFLTSTIGFLPKVLALFATLSLTVSIVYLIAGRVHSG